MLINLFKLVFLSIILTFENINGINITSCDPTYGPAGLCMVDTICSGVLIGWHRPENVTRLGKCFILLKNNDLGTNETFEYSLLERKQFNIIKLNQLISNSSYNLTIKFTSYYNGSKFILESDIKFNFTDVSVEQDCQESLSFVEVNTRGMGRLEWKVRPDLHLHKGRSINIAIYNSSNARIQNTYHNLDNYETVLDINLKNLKENSSYKAVLSTFKRSRSRSTTPSNPTYVSLLLFKTQENYDYPLKPQNLHIGDMSQSTYSNLIKVNLTWELPGNLDNIFYFIETTNLRTGRIEKYKKEKLILKPCTNYSVTVTAKFQANNSYSQSTIEFETLKTGPDYMYKHIIVEGQNVTIKRNELKISSCPMTGFHINATGISNWDDVVEQTEALTIYQHQYTFVNLHPATDYTFSYIPFNEEGIYKNILQIKVVTGDGVPTAVENVVVVRSSDASTKIKWTPAKLTPGKVIRYWIEVTDFDTEQFLLLSTVEAGTNQLNVQSVNFKGRYIFATVWPQNSVANGTKVDSRQFKK